MARLFAPIFVGGVYAHVNYINPSLHAPEYGSVGMRFMQPSCSDENVAVPASDVYLVMKHDEILNLIAYLSDVAEKLKPKEIIND